MIRFFDFIISFLLILILSPLMLFSFLILMFECKSPIFKQQRLGLNCKIFTIYKFRTLPLHTPDKASHLTDIQDISKLAVFLRFSKLDELPQLFNVLKGDMSMVGPRPNLCNQYELIELRFKYNVYSVKPGITGFAQINKIDMSKPKLLVKYDTLSINLKIYSYFKIIFLTFSGFGSNDPIR